MRETLKSECTGEDILSAVYLRDKWPQCVLIVWM